METQEDCTIFEVTGNLNATDIVVQATKCLSGKKTDTFLWDFTQASRVDISTAEIKGIVSSIEEISTDRKIQKVALVGSKNINIGLLKFLSAIAEIYDSPNEHQVFRDIDLAKDWLRKTT